MLPLKSLGKYGTMLVLLHLDWLQRYPTKYEETGSNAVAGGKIFT